MQGAGFINTQSVMSSANRKFRLVCEGCTLVILVMLCCTVQPILSGWRPHSSSCLFQYAGDGQQAESHTHLCGGGCHHFVRALLVVLQVSLIPIGKGLISTQRESICLNGLNGMWCVTDLGGWLCAWGRDGRWLWLFFRFDETTPDYKLQHWLNYYCAEAKTQVLTIDLTIKAGIRGGSLNLDGPCIVPKKN